jgi:hypothetical protein
MDYNWDKTASEEEILIRRMLYDDPRTLLKNYEKDFLKKLFLKNFYKFDKKNKSFWKLVLDVSDEEIDRITKESFRNSVKIWDY